MFRALRARNYRVWFAGALVSNVGTWMQRTAQDWIVLTRLSDDDATAIGIVMALQMGPALVFMPLTGLAADRFDRRRLLMTTQGLMGVLGLALAVLTVTGAVQLWHVYVFAFLLGTVSAFDIPAKHTFVTDLVGTDNVGNAVALNSASFTSARLIGPAVAGVLTAAIGAGWVFMIDAASFAATVAALLAVRRADLFPTPRASRERGQLMAGFRYIASRPDIVLILTIAFIVGAFGLNFSIFTATMARVEFGAGAAAFGTLAAVMAIGSIAGALAAARIERPRLRYVVAASGAFGLTCLVSAAMPGLVSFAVSLAFVGVASQLLMTGANATVQTTTAPELRGRVMSVYFAIFAGGTPIGAPIVGAIANAAGPRWGLVVGGLSGIVALGLAVVWMLVSTRRGTRVPSASSREPGEAASCDRA